MGEAGGGFIQKLPLHTYDCLLFFQSTQGVNKQHCTENLPLVLTGTSDLTNHDTRQNE